MPTCPQGWASDVVCGTCKAPTFEKRQQTWLEYSSNIRDLGIKWQLCLVSKRTPNQTLELEVKKLEVRSSIQLRKMCDRTLQHSRPHPDERRDYNNLHAGIIGVLATVESSVPTNW
jgi:hypothetical protein